MKLLDKLRAFNERVAWQAFLLRLYPTRQAFAEAVQRHLDGSAQAAAMGKSEGFQLGYRAGYGRGYCEGFDEALKRAKVQFEEEFGKELVEKRVRVTH